MYVDGVAATATKPEMLLCAHCLAFGGLVCASKKHSTICVLRRRRRIADKGNVGALGNEKSGTHSPKANLLCLVIDFAHGSDYNK